MAILNITNANTFGQWLSTTQSLVVVANSLTDGPIFTANTDLRLIASNTTLTVANTARFTGNVNISGSGFGLNVSNSVYIGGDLLVGGNVTLDSSGFDDLYVTSNTITGNLTVSNSATINMATITVIGGSAINQFDSFGTGVAMSIALG